MIAFCVVQSLHNQYSQNLEHICIIVEIYLWVNMLLLCCFSLQKELFKSAMELVEENEKSEEVTTPTDPNVRMVIE